jgi:hypothetical protein
MAEQYLAHLVTLLSSVERTHFVSVRRTRHRRSKDCITSLKPIVDHNLDGPCNSERCNIDILGIPLIGCLSLADGSYLVPPPRCPPANLHRRCFQPEVTRSGQADISVHSLCLCILAPSLLLIPRALVPLINRLHSAERNATAHSG